MARHRQCDGMTRRDAIKVGVIGSAAGLSIGQFSQLAQAGAINEKASGKAAIFVELVGGPSHLDTFDLKPNGPSEIRGPFASIKTNVPGVEICEHLPQLAKSADKFAILRGVSHSLGAHALGQRFVFTGNRPTPSLEYPSLGPVFSRGIAT